MSGNKVLINFIPFLSMQNTVLIPFFSCIIKTLLIWLSNHLRVMEASLTKYNTQPWSVLTLHQNPIIFINKTFFPICLLLDTPIYLLLGTRLLVGLAKLLSSSSIMQLNGHLLLHLLSPKRFAKLAFKTNLIIHFTLYMMKMYPINRVLFIPK